MIQNRPASPTSKQVGEVERMSYQDLRDTYGPRSHSRRWKQRLARIEAGRRLIGGPISLEALWREVSFDPQEEA